MPRGWHRFFFWVCFFFYWSMCCLRDSVTKGVWAWKHHEGVSFASATDGQTQAGEVGAPGETLPSAQALQAAAGALKGLGTRAAPLYVSRIPAPEALARARYCAKPSRAQPKVWARWQGNRVLFCVCDVNRCEERSRSSCGCSDPIWLRPFNYKETFEHGSFPPAEL